MMCILLSCTVIALLLRGSVLKETVNARGDLGAQKSIHLASESDAIPLPLQSTMEAIHQHMIADAFALLPKRCTSSLKHLFVRYDNPERRGMAGASTIILDGNQPHDEFRALFIHEFGHVIDLGCLSGTSESAISVFKDGSMRFFENDPSVTFYEISWKDEFTQKTDARAEDFVSGYAQEDAFEDFAETFAYYILQQERFKERVRENEELRKKYRWMRRYLFNGTVPNIVEGLSTENDGIPWDITKLPYIWKPTLIAKKQGY